MVCNYKTINQKIDDFNKAIKICQKRLVRIDKELADSIIIEETVLDRVIEENTRLYIIIVDMRPNNISIIFITNEFGNAAMFDTYEEAADLMKNHPLNMFPYRIVSIDDIMEPYPNKPIST